MFIMQWPPTNWEDLAEPFNGLTDYSKQLFANQRYRENRSNSEYNLEFDVPGVPSESVTADVYDDNVLIVRGETDNRKYEFELSLPEDVDTDNVIDKVENGVFSLTFPIVEEEKSGPKSLRKAA